MRLAYSVAVVGFIYARFWSRRSVQMQKVTNPDGQTGLKYFKSTEFGVWWPFMSPVLLQKLDALREMWGDSITISPAVGSVGRTYPLGHKNYNSRHNVVKYGEVQAVDIMPLISTTTGQRSLDPFELRMLYQMALEVGFTGIGAYPGWSPHAGLHVDVRDDHKAGNPATWSGIRTAQGQEYFGIEKAFT